ncbi:hypothetical protein B0H11DRAFT_2261792 [Mycena galericulata]|nr:hypothetical protein B0H11DRAFT_2261792 [Mycena galericulata]
MPTSDDNDTNGDTELSLSSGGDDEPAKPSADPLATLPEEEEERIRREKAAAASALTLEMVSDLPFANVRPPENVLFVCKLNPVTRDDQEREEGGEWLRGAAGAGASGYYAAWDAKGGGREKVREGERVGNESGQSESERELH